MTDVTKFTPGPWEVYSGLAKVTGKPFRVVRVYDMKTVCASVNRYSDARLIAAAPELLHALQELIDSVDYIDTDGKMNGFFDACLTLDDLRNARSAIAKATGSES